MDRYLARMKSLPINPSVAAKVLETLERRDFSFKQLEDLIGADPGLTARILKIANSALYARQAQITKLQMAMTLLGLNAIKSLVVLVTGASLFSGQGGSRFCGLYWSHSLASAFLSRDLAKAMGLSSFADEAFIGGLLHNIGQVAMFLEHGPAYESLLESLKSSSGRFSALETERFGVSHRVVGRMALDAWHFPAQYVDCAMEHGESNIRSPHKQLVLIVTVASFIASNWVYFDDDPKPLSLLGAQLAQLPSSSLGPEGLDGYQSRYREELKKDAFYNECLALIKG